MEIIPAILTDNVGDLKNKIAQIATRADFVQIDMVDGIFAPSRTWPFNGQDRDFYERLQNEEEGMPYWQDVQFELDLMVQNAHEKMDFFYVFGASRIVFHVEAEGDPKRFAEFLEALDPYLRDTIQFGVAFNIATDPKEYTAVIQQADFVQCMGIAEIGLQGEPFDERVYEKIDYFRENFPGLPISVDGAVNEASVPELARRGVTRFVAGSVIWKTMDPIGKIRELERLAKGVAKE